MRPKQQKSISSFFKSSRSESNIEVEPPKVSRQGSILSKSDYDQGFDDHDTSIDTSFEVTNLKTTSKILKETSTHNKPFIPLKRSSSSVLDSINLGNAKKVKTESKIVIHSEQEGIVLNNEQKEVISAVVDQGLNVFYSGSAGTGKSVVLRELVKRLARKYGAHRIGVTAPTGMAACNIEGQTIYKFLSLGTGKLKAEQLAKNIAKNEFIKHKWLKLRVLIVDEVSMLDGDLFERINQVGKILRGNSKPFGGIQIVLSGDFYQLPPVNREVAHKNFCFLKPSWNETIQKSLLLTEIFRQKGDSEFIDMLNGLRNGNLTQEIINKFMALRREVVYEDGIVATELYSTKFEVSKANSIKLDELKSTQIYQYKANDSHSGEQYKNQYNSLMCEEVLFLKEGAQVMMLKNIDERLVNGTQGHVLFFTTQAFYFKILEKYAVIDPEDRQMIDELRMVCSRIGNHSEFTDYQKEIFNKVPESRRPLIEELCQYASVDYSSEKLPVVNFKSNGDNIVHLVTRLEFTADHKSSTLSSVSQITRTQIPLLLSWAMSIHKSQGQTLDRVKIDLNKSFEEGQAYVALSRARSKDRLELRGFNPHKVLTSSIVLQFYKQIQSSNN